MKKIIFLIGCFWIAITGIANNVVISNISLIGLEPGGFPRVKFDLSWDNGWRVSTGQNNYDGVWVFFKYRTPGGNWQHLYMNGTAQATPQPYTFHQNSGSNKPGVIIHSAINFTGTSTLTNIEMAVNVTGFDLEIRGYAIEMVRIPQCTNCIIGDGDGSSESVSALHVIDNTSGGLGSTFSVDVNGFDDATLESGIAINAAGIAGNTAFPTGQAFWSMKYELSQGAYRDFLNALTLAQQTSRTANTPTSATGVGALTMSGTSRNFIEIATPSIGVEPAVYGCDASGNNIFDEAADGEWDACNFLSWPDIAAYLDWAGLAPMTEIMYERICRGASNLGANPSLFGEFAWGTTGIFSSNYTLSAPFTAAETASNSSTLLGNANYISTTVLGVGGPLRNGIFAGPATNRITSGAAFYGVMEMSGNLFEPTITVGNVAGRSFTSVNGDGILTGNGDANVLNWPSTSNGTMKRGGSFLLNSTILAVSLRSQTTVNGTRDNHQGCRGVLYIN